MYLWYSQIIFVSNDWVGGSMSCVVFLYIGIGSKAIVV